MYGNRKIDSNIKSDATTPILVPTLTSILLSTWIPIPTASRIIDDMKTIGDTKTKQDSTMTKDDTETKDNTKTKAS